LVRPLIRRTDASAEGDFHARARARARGGDASDGDVDCDDRECHAYRFCAKSSPEQQRLRRPLRSFRFGFSLVPGVLINRLERTTSPTRSSEYSVGAQIAIRVGYQFRRWVGLVAEPAVGFYRHVRTEPSSMTGDRTVITLGLSALVVFDVKRVLLAAGPSIGGLVVCEPPYGCLFQPPFVRGGFTVRVGGDVLGQRRYAVPVGLSLQALVGGAASTWMFNGAPPESTALLNVALDVGFDMFR
jgi:hypothetical protein